MRQRNSIMSFLFNSHDILLPGQIVQYKYVSEVFFGTGSKKRSNLTIW